MLNKLPTFDSVYNNLLDIKVSDIAPYMPNSSYQNIAIGSAILGSAYAVQVYNEGDDKSVFAGAGIGLMAFLVASLGKIACENMHKSNIFMAATAIGASFSLYCLVNPSDKSVGSVYNGFSEKNIGVITATFATSTLLGLATGSLAYGAQEGMKMAIS